MGGVTVNRSIGGSLIFCWHLYPLNLLHITHFEMSLLTAEFLLMTQYPLLLNSDNVIPLPLCWVSWWHHWIISWVIYPSFGRVNTKFINGYLFNLPPSHNLLSFNIGSRLYMLLLFLTSDLNSTVLHWADISSIKRCFCYSFKMICSASFNNFTLKSYMHQCLQAYFLLISAACFWIGLSKLQIVSILSNILFLLMIPIYLIEM